MTHTFATLEVPQTMYDFVAQKLREAGYSQAFVDGAIDMHGIGLVPAPAQPATDVPAPDPISAALELLGLSWCQLCAADGRSGFYHVDRPDECPHDDEALGDEAALAAYRDQRLTAVAAAIASLTPAMALAAAGELHDRESLTDYRGLDDRFIVTRRDGGHEPGRKHDGCRYFPLDLTHDRHAIPAIIAYAASCEQDRPRLARELRFHADRLHLTLTESAG